ncbi:aldo/keto reductase [Caulobacter vibrioides]|nr:aldo/keto reductase [Caulobacter vibrioides]YP_002519150.1 NADP(H)-dependent aldo-keto reductase [Caulobacter vibrioides NA1000]ACL97242.1 NADP(H)-dependent aldo-keto reductase [Caulobacter vibrioides NA1000]ATC30463.1 aldo/keto reductase [Caulobacter vibrioides]QXZ51998.1 aldo/keto reductase [Caulobacter vibrioides]
MEYAKLGRSDVMVSRCCLGTMTWGSQNTEAEAHEQMDYALSRGVNFWDTAELYASPPNPETQGLTETYIGSWLRKTGKRSEIVLASKVAGQGAAFGGLPWLRKDGAVTRQTKAQIDEAVEGSLRRLGTDYLDLYQLHWPDRRVRVFGGQTYKDYSLEFERFGDILLALDAHVKKGAIRHVGVSNEFPWGVMRFLSESDTRGLPRIASIQNAYHLANRTFEYGLAEIAMREQVGLLAYSPLAQGQLTGKYLDGALPAGSRKALYNRMQRYEGPGAIEAFRNYVDLARAHGLDPAQLALKFCDARPFVTATIIGATSMDQLKINIDAFDIAWTDALEKAVDAIHLRHPNPCP